MSDIKKSSNKSFGIVFSIVFLLIGLYPLINYDQIRFWALIIAFIFLTLGLLNSKILTPLNEIWFKIGIILGKLISPIIMAIIFFFVVTPIALLMRLAKKDILNLRYNNNETYWMEKSTKKSTMKNQF